MIKCCFHWGFKKIIGLFLLFIIFFSGINSVYSKILTIDEISNELNTTFNNELNKLGINLSSSIDTTNKTLDIYGYSKKVASFKYTDEYIEYDNRSAVVSMDTIEEDIQTISLLGAISQSILKLSGHGDKTISNDDNIDFTATYDTYGVQMETENFEYSDENDDRSWSISGNYIKYFKISFDTDKIEALITTYGTNIEDQDSNIEILNSLKPTLEAKDITEDSVTLYPNINYYNIDSNSEVSCFLYRSNDENGTYEKISDITVNCLGEVGIVDENLKSNTTYYYKAIVYGGTIYSDPIKVTTKDTKPVNVNNKNSNYKDDFIENVKTGVTFPIITITLGLIGSVVAILYSKKKSVFKKI